MTEKLTNGETPLLFVVFFISGTALAYFFDRILPVEFEPFRSLLFPTMVFVIIFVITARLLYPK